MSITGLCKRSCGEHAKTQSDAIAIIAFVNARSRKRLENMECALVMASCLKNGTPPVANRTASGQGCDAGAADSALVTPAVCVWVMSAQRDVVADQMLSVPERSETKYTAPFAVQMGWKFANWP